MKESKFIRKWLGSIFCMGLIHCCWGQYYQSTIVENISWANNAAVTGTIEEYSGKGAVSYRSQWGIDSPYRDIFAAYQYRLKDFSFGGKIIREDAGEASLARTRIVGDFAYQKQLNYEGDMIGVGVSGGFLQSRISSGPLKFDAQYTEGIGFDPMTDSGELLLDGDRMNPVFDAGFIYKKYFFSSNIIIGLSAQNLNNFLENSVSDIALQPTVYTIYSKYQIEFEEGLKAEAFISYQKYANVNVPALLITGRYKINDDYECIFGLGKRLHNTVMGQVGINWKNIEINLGFDIANTTLPISTSIIELGGTYSFKAK